MASSILVKVPKEKDIDHMIKFAKTLKSDLETRLKLVETFLRKKRKTIKTVNALKTGLFAWFVCLVCVYWISGVIFLSDLLEMQKHDDKDPKKSIVCLRHSYITTHNIHTNLFLVCFL